MIKAVIGILYCALVLPLFGDSANPVQLDKQFAHAVARKEAGALINLLSENFTWTNASGRTISKSEFLKDVSRVDLSADAKPHEYGSVVYFTGTTGNEGSRRRLVRVWANQGDSWKLVLFQETKLAGKVAAAQATVPAGTPCDNPCKGIPYDPPSAEAQAVVVSWEQLEDAVNHRDADAWASHVADEFVFNVKENGNPLTKADRIAIIKKQAQGQTATDIGTVIPGSMKVYVYGSSAVMSDDQQPTIGGHPYHAMRVWVKRDDRWQLVYSQQTVIEDRAGRPTPAVRSGN